MGTINKLSEETNKFKIDKKSRRRLKKHTTEYLPKTQIANKTDEFIWSCISTLSNFWRLARISYSVDPIQLFCNKYFSSRTWKLCISYWHPSEWMTIKYLKPYTRSLHNENGNSSERIKNTFLPPDWHFQCFLALWFECLLENVASGITDPGVHCFDHINNLKTSSNISSRLVTSFTSHKQNPRHLGQTSALFDLV